MKQKDDDLQELETQVDEIKNKYETQIDELRTKCAQVDKEYNKITVDCEV